MARKNGESGTRRLTGRKVAVGLLLAAGCWLAALVLLGGRWSCSPREQRVEPALPPAADASLVVPDGPALAGRSAPFGIRAERDGDREARASRTWVVDATTQRVLRTRAIVHLAESSHALQGSVLEHELPPMLKGKGTIAFHCLEAPVAWTWPIELPAGGDRIFEASLPSRRLRVVVRGGPSVDLERPVYVATTHAVAAGGEVWNRQPLSLWSVVGPLGDSPWQEHRVEEEGALVLRVPQGAYTALTAWDKAGHTGLALVPPEQDEVTIHLSDERSRIRLTYEGRPVPQGWTVRAWRYGSTVPRWGGTVGPEGSLDLPGFRFDGGPTLVLRDPTSPALLPTSVAAFDAPDEWGPLLAARTVRGADVEMPSGRMVPFDVVWADQDRVRECAIRVRVQPAPLAIQTLGVVACRDGTVLLPRWIAEERIRLEVSVGGTWIPARVDVGERRLHLERPARIEGAVRDAASGKAVAHALVSVVHQDEEERFLEGAPEEGVLTDATGAFGIVVPRDPSVRIVVRAAGYEPVALHLSAFAAGGLDIRLCPLTTIRIRAGDVAAMRGARVRVLLPPSVPGVAVEALLDEQGEATLRVPGGRDLRGTVTRRDGLMRAWRHPSTDGPTVDLAFPDTVEHELHIHAGIQGLVRRVVATWQTPGGHLTQEIGTRGAVARLRVPPEATPGSVRLVGEPGLLASWHGHSQAIPSELGGEDLRENVEVLSTGWTGAVAGRVGLETAVAFVKEAGVTRLRLPLSPVPARIGPVDGIGAWFARPIGCVHVDHFVVRQRLVLTARFAQRVKGGPAWTVRTPDVVVSSAATAREITGFRGGSVAGELYVGPRGQKGEAIEIRDTGSAWELDLAP